MNDIATRLRSCVTASRGIDCQNPDLLLGAADEIDKLRAEIAAEQKSREPEKLDWRIGAALILVAAIWCGVVYTGCQYSTSFCTGVRAFFGVR